MYTNKEIHILKYHKKHKTGINLEKEKIGL